MRSRFAAMALLGLIVPLLPVILLLWDQADFLVTSDTLLPAALTWDLLHLPDAWANFQQPRVSSLAPDWAMFAVVQAITGQWRIAMAASTAMLLVWLMALGSWITARLVHVDGATARRALLMVSLPVLAAALLTCPKFTPVPNVDTTLFAFLFVTVPYSHGGPFLLGLSAAALASRVPRRPTVWRVSAVALLCAAATLSDLLSIVTILAPLTLALLGVAWTRQRRGLGALLPPCAVGVGGMVGWLGFNLLWHQSFGERPLGGDPLISAIHGLGQLAQYPVMLAVLVAFAMLVTSDFSYRGMRRWLGGFWPLFAVGSAGGSLLMTLLRFEDAWSFRLATPFLWWTVILAAAGLARARLKRPDWQRGTLALATLGLAAVFSRGGWHVPDLLRWQSPIASCLRAAGLREGLAQYWTARELSAASDWTVPVEQLYSDGLAYVWGNDPRWFRHDIRDWSRPAQFQFIVMDDLVPEQIAALYGAPERALDCGTSRVWVYADSDRLGHDLLSVSRERFAAAGPGE